ncbi:PfkB family carbohydrate kinase [Kribbella sp. NBC_01505]|uniref:PfkB family carbohydrate kinase n=1 Tax=Kribbella sp. NBC_01505 TaxID=2903580 RepID=UPI00386AFD2B
MSGVRPPHSWSAGLVVVGDVLLDRDVIGRAERLSPESPVPVVDKSCTVQRPGGAGLAALLGADAGQPVTLVTALAEDEAGEALRTMLEAAGVRLVDLGSPGRTAIKTRIRVAGHTLLRIDDTAPTASVRGRRLDTAAEVLGAADAVLVADYGRGLVSQPQVRRLLPVAASRIPLVWDPHPRGSRPVRGARLITPSRSEARHFVTRPPGDGLATDIARARILVQRWQAAAVAVTRGQQGAVLVQHPHGTPLVVPVTTAKTVLSADRVPDVCGAGDRFAVAAALCLANGEHISEAVTNAVSAATDYVASGGPAGLGDRPRSRERPLVDALGLGDRVRGAGGTVVAAGGCFDVLHSGHVRMLEQARQLGDCLIVCVNSDASVARLKGPGRPVVPALDRVAVLQALSFVDAVAVFEENVPLRLLAELRPHLFVKGGDYDGADIPEHGLVRSWGGEVVTMPYLAGRSTTAMIQQAAAREQAQVTGTRAP